MTFNNSQFLISCAELSKWTLQMSCRQHCNDHLTRCSLPDGKLRHQGNLQSSKALSCTHKAQFVLYYHKHIVTSIPLRHSPVAENLFCVAIGETMSYAATYMCIYTIYTPPCGRHPWRHHSFQVAVVSLVLGCFLSFRICLALKKELEKFSYISSYLYLALWQYDCHLLLYQMKDFQCCLPPCLFRKPI